ncbi:autotransporter outer membrane beta-barrel domain-containing protein [Oxalobacter aliiformigenes]|uniref:autotransporter outer membrane beta-barrel domain-containing protein n=2 Tax=Oxalobacter aliiformigenes TaxID=2946593 RepID=UPI0022B01E3E|nr:autotransporter outer membrane beta-barrel domain-containing protein [Oxalobacter aliiformigenes]WAW00005.1 autotransporter outer membrane beta-barrel domain-containing protein [Oxalobacter aliiformigenes]
MKKTLLATALAAAMPCVAMANDIGTVTVDGTEQSVNIEISPTTVGENASIVVINGADKRGITVDVQDNEAVVLGNNITVTSNTTETIRASNGGVVSLGGSNTQTVDLTGPDTGLVALKGGQINVQTEKLTISGGDYGIWSQNNSQDASAPEGTSSITVNAKDTVINANKSGIVAFSNGQVNISGNLIVNAQNALDVRGNSTTNINQDGTGTVVLNGDISFETPGPDHNSGNIIDATVNLNLAGENSSWTGNVSKGYPAERENTSGQNDVGAREGTGLNLTLSNGAQWNPTVITASVDEQYQTRTESMALTNLTMNNGVININDVNQTVNVQKMQGTGGTVNVAAQANSDGTLQAASLKVGSAVDSSEIGGGQAGSASGHLAVNYQGIDADDLGADTAAAMTQLASNIQAQGATQTQTVAEGDVAGAVIAQINEDGNVSAVTESANSVMGSLHQIAQNNFLVFRSQMNDMDKRMGDLRTLPQASGMWARAIAGQSEYKNMHNTYQTLQIGADRRIGNFLVGATASYTDGDGSLKNGSSDDKNYSFGLYGSWLGDDGQFVDVTLKRHHTQSDYDLYYTRGEKVDGSMHTTGTSLSVEYGRRFNIANTHYYLEPQAELMYGHLDSADYTTGNGVRISQDAIKSLVGRLGIAAGWVSPDKTGSAYIKASILNDWEAESDIRASKDGISRKYSEDMGGTWGEFALGGTWNINKNLAAYGEVETTAGNPVRTTYQVSGGIRYSF